MIACRDTNPADVMRCSCRPASERKNRTYSTPRECILRKDFAYRGRGVGEAGT